ncbi:MAG: Clp protease N-terminal domain-containing protein [Arachnia sp.]
MSALTMPIPVTAAWREAVRARDPYIDLDHLLIGLITAGGAASRLLTRHGLTVPSTRAAARAAHADAVGLLGVDADRLPPTAPQSLRELNQDGRRMPMAGRAERLLGNLGARAGERELLRALLTEGSGTITELTERAGVDVGALLCEVESRGAWVTPVPRRARYLEAQRADGTVVVELDHFVAAELPLVRTVAIDQSHVAEWLILPDDMEPAPDGGLRTTMSRRGRSSTLLVTLSTDEGCIRWTEHWDGEPTSWYDLHLVEAEGGTAVNLARGVRPIGVLGAAMRPVIRQTNGLGLLLRAQNLSMACAEVTE